MGQLEPETQAVREFYAALNRGDVPAALNAFDAQIEVIEPPEFPMAGTYHGLAAVKEHFTKRAPPGPKAVASRNGSSPPATRSSPSLKCE